MGKPLVNASVVTMTAPLSNFTACPGSTEEPEVSDATVKITMMMFRTATTLEYAGSVVDIPAHTMKFTLETENWYARPSRGREIGQGPGGT